VSFDLTPLLEPLSSDRPCGPELGTLPNIDQLKTVSLTAKPGQWATQYEQALEAATACRDLRVWVWLTRAGLSSEGWAGLCAGLELIADGLDRYWDVLPPYDPDEAHSHHRYEQRLLTLYELGASNSQMAPGELAKRPEVYLFAQELEQLVTRASASPELQGFIARIERALDRIETRFRTSFANGSDIQLGFELLRSKLAALKKRLSSASSSVAVEALASTAAQTSLQRVTSREEAIRALNLVLEYYQTHEPSSPVPLLVERAKRLVRSTFVEAMKELAPGGLKELSLATGSPEDAKGKKAGE
jgi:type VI secretion system protein ImpA